MSGAELKWVRWRARLGFPLALACLWFARPSPASITTAAAIALLGVFIRASAAGHLRKSEIVATSGPYAHTRNPLYFGSALLGAAFVIGSRSWVVAALVTFYYLALYPFLMRREEAELRALFGSVFDDYAKRVPLFWPRLASAGKGGLPRQTGVFSWTRYARNREYQTSLGVVLLLGALWAIYLWRG